MINDKKTMDISHIEQVHHESKYVTLIPVLFVFIAIVCCYIWFSFYRKTNTVTTAITPVQTLGILREVSTSSEFTTKEKEASLSKLTPSSKSVEDGMADLNRLNK